MKSFALLASLALLISCSSDPRQEKDDNKRPAPQYEAERQVENNLLSSNALPAIQIQVSDVFEYVGEFPFQILALSDEYDESIRGQAIAEGERFVFAKADTNKSVEQLFIVQLEGFIPGFDMQYNYSFQNAETIGNNQYRHNTWFYDSKQLAIDNPKGEGALTRTFLEERGYQLEDAFMMTRYVGLASEDRKNEIIIYYLDMLQKTTGYTLDQYENELTDAEKKAIRDALIERGRSNFSIIQG